MIHYPAVINDPCLDGAARLAALKAWEGERQGTSAEKDHAEINNHIHTIYSFSPYTPSMAAFLARDAGLGAAGSVDHDSVAAAGEMIEACAVLGIGGCAGFEMRVSFKNGPDGEAGPFAGRKINNPDSEGLAYMTVQGILKQSINAAAEFLVPVRQRRLERTRTMTGAANGLLREAGLGEIDFQRDIIDKSKYAEGGGITERHLLAAMAEKCVREYGKGKRLVGALESKMGIQVPPKLAAVLEDPGNPHYLYDLLGLFKSGLLGSIFIQPDDNECIPAQSVTAFAQSITAIPAYAYLGDVGESPTGDKKAEKFEDDYIEELFFFFFALGYRAVTYMLPRNSLEPFRRVRRLCAKWGLMEISGVDINSSRQSFNCPQVLQDEFRHLVDTTWALIAHERLASTDERFGLFSAGNPLASLDLASRIAAYAQAGKKLDPYHPEESAASIAEEITKGRFV
jgi:hypothetical protein